MQGQYKTQKGEMVKVEIFDAENKMVYVQIPNGQHKWYIESEYKDWVSTEPKIVYAEPKVIEGGDVKIWQHEVAEPKEVKPKKPTPNKNAKTNKK